MTSPRKLRWKYFGTCTSSAMPKSSRYGRTGSPRGAVSAPRHRFGTERHESSWTTADHASRVSPLLDRLQASWPNVVRPMPRFEQRWGCCRPASGRHSCSATYTTCLRKTSQKSCTADVERLGHSCHGRWQHFGGTRVCRGRPDAPLCQLEERVCAMSDADAGDVLIVVASRTPFVSRGVREWRDSARPGWWGQTLQSAADSGISRATMPSALTSSTPTCRRMASTPSCLR